MFPWIITLLLLAVWAETAAVIPYSALAGSLSGSSTLYSSDTTSMTVGSFQEYIVNYGTTMASIPEMMYCMTAFEDNSNFGNTYLRTSIDTQNNPLTTFKIYVMLSGAASIRKLGISYMAMIDTYSAINILPIEFSSFSSINTGSGPRTEAKTTNYLLSSGGHSLNSDVTKNVGAAFMTGYSMTIVSQFKLSLSLTITTATSLSTIISTDFDCLVNMVRLRYLLIDTGLWASADPAIIVNYASYEGSSTSAVVSNFDSQTTKMMGLVGFAGTIDNNLLFEYQRSSANTVTFANSNEISSITYGFVLIGQAGGCPSTYPYFEDASQNSCLDQCPSTFTQTPSSSTCESCDISCSECGSTSIDCTSCPTGFELTGNICQYVEPTTTSQNSEESPTKQTSMLPLLGFLGVIPVAGGIVYFLLRRRNFRVIECSDRIQPEISL